MVKGVGNRVEGYIQESELGLEIEGLRFQVLGSGFRIKS